MIKEIEYPSYATGGIQRVSWGAILAGTVVCVSTVFALSSLGLGIGLVSAPAADSGEGLLKGMTIGTAVWALLTGIAAFYFGGWIAGRLTGIARISESVIHGVVTWGLASLVLSLLVASAMFGAVGAAANLTGQALAPATEAVAQRGAQPGGVDQLQRAGQELAQEARQAMGRPQGGEGGVEAGGGGEAGETASKVAGGIGLFGFFMILCDLFACSYGARAGTRVLRPVSMPEYRREHVGHKS